MRRNYLLSLAFAALLLSLGSARAYAAKDDLALEDEKRSAPGTGGADTWEIGAEGDTSFVPRKDPEESRRTPAEITEVAPKTPAPTRVDPPLPPPPRMAKNPAPPPPPPPPGVPDDQTLAPLPPPPPENNGYRAMAPEPPGEAASPDDLRDGGDELYEPSHRASSAESRGTGKNYYSPMDLATDIQFSTATFKDYVILGSVTDDSPDGVKASNSSKGLRLSVEYIPFQTFGKLAFGGAISAYTGKQNLGPSADVSVIVLPVEAFVAYRAEIWRHQTLVPHARIGPTMLLSQQSSNSGYYSKWRSTPALEVAAGLALNLRAFGPVDARRLDYNYGINDTFLLLEVGFVEPLKKDGDIKLNYTAYRAGLRFEY